MVRQSTPDGTGRPGGADQVRWFPVFRGQAGRCSGTVRGGRGAGFRWPRDRGQDGHDASQGRPDVRFGNVLQEGRATLSSGESLGADAILNFFFNTCLGELGVPTILYCTIVIWYICFRYMINKNYQRK